MIDIHCHILPGIDDGSQSMESSLQMAKMAVNDGIKTIIATPHIDHADYPKNILIGTIDLLNGILRTQKIPLTILFGGEVQAHIALAVGTIFCLAGGTSMLIEFPHSYLPGDAIELITNLRAKLITPIIAHPERNSQIAEEPWILKSLIDQGSRIQITAGSITGELGMTAKTCADYLLQNNMVHYIATDSHSPGFRKPILSKAVKKAAKIIGKQHAKKLVSGPDILPFQVI